MKKNTILISLISANALLAAQPTIGDIQRQVQPPKEVERAINNAIPSIGEEPLKEPMMEESGKRIEVKGFKFSGVVHMSKDKLLSRIKGYVGQTHTFSDLQKMTSLITKAYREEGYFVARAYIPKQRMDEGILEIAIIEGNYGAFHLKNSSLVSNERVQGMLESATRENVISTHTLERAMLLINDTPGVNVTGADVKPGENVGTSDFEMKTEASNPYSAYIVGDNYGSKYTGRHRVNVGVSANSPLGYGDKFGINGVLSSTTDLKNGKVYYNFPVMDNGLRGEVSASRTTYSLAEEYKALDALGHSTTLEASLSYPLIRTRLESLHLSLGYAHKKMQDEIESTNDVTKKDSNALSIGANYLKHHTLFGLNSTLSSELKLTKGVLDSPSNSDTDGAYAKVAGSVEHTMAFSPQYTLTTSLRFQHALGNKNLDGSEDFSLGGAYGVRAFPDGEHSAENGYILGAELFYTLPSFEAITHKASLFADTGYATMQNENGTQESRQLSDIGIGYQASYKQFFGKAQIARVIGGDKVESESERSTKLLVQLGFVY
ncbi:MAG: ShlB/FhaC/HecB family hemolysin secretion/activation protein [Epsilonproteobacteria bacterium]|nr:ShlB/FhaC/HecB family hemolysin secretion/activation protein [Campylobacterota bacterium]